MKITGKAAGIGSGPPLIAEFGVAPVMEVMQLMCRRTILLSVSSFAHCER
jgi:hypothetical protein